MYIEITNSGFKVIGKEPLKLNLKQLGIESFSFAISGLKYPIPNKKDTLFETIKIKDGKVYNLEYHQKRVDFAYKNLFYKESELKLQNTFKDIPQNGLFRAKIIYNKEGLIECDYFKYKKKSISKIALVELDLDYNYKYLDRSYFDILFKKFDFDEFLITKNGYLTDTTISNIALLNKNNTWHTPKEPLLRGTTRQRYIEASKLIKKMIHYHNLKEYSKLAMLNAMIDFNILGV